MTSPNSEPSQTLHGFVVSYEELLFYGKQHIIGKRVRSFDVSRLLGILNPHGSFCSERSRCSSMVRRRPLPFSPHLFPLDYIVTFEEELNFVWRVAPRARFSIAKLLFIAVRHDTLDCWAILMHAPESLFTHNQFYPSFCFLRVRTAIGQSAIILPLR